jgi:hypothetical protein
MGKMNFPSKFPFYVQLGLVELDANLPEMLFVVSFDKGNNRSNSSPSTCCSISLITISV